MPIGMKSVTGGVQTHVGDPLFEPEVKLVAEQRGEGSLSVWNLKDRVVPEAFVLAVHFDQSKNRLDRTKKRILRSSEWNLVHAFAELVVLGFLHGDDDAVVDVVVKRGNVFPA